MKKFIFKSSLFIIPFIFLHFINYFLYVRKEGDLSRLGYLYHNPTPTSVISKQFSLPKHYTLVSELDLNNKEKYDILTIGDSFSEQESLGYKNFLAKEGYSVLHIDRFLSDNPIQKLVELINNDFFETIETEYIVLQSVERLFVQRCQEIDFSKSLSLNSVKEQIKENKNTFHIPGLGLGLDFFSKETLKIPLTNIQYFFSEKPLSSRTYKVATIKNNLFTGDPDNLLFFQDDLEVIIFKNDSLKIINSNNILNKINDLLSKKNIKLIVLISPDKYDLYYPYIKNKDNFKESHFFKNYNILPKEYVSINSFEILTMELDKGKDIYYYDDTHWSPIGANIIAQEIKKSIHKHTID